MTAPKVRSDFNALTQIAQSFGREATNTHRYTQNLKSKMAQLRGGDWVGKAATKYYNEMDSAILPSLNRLINALVTAQRTVMRIAQIMQMAEQQSAALFRLDVKGLMGGMGLGGMMPLGGLGMMGGIGKGGMMPLGGLGMMGMGGMGMGGMMPLGGMGAIGGLGKFGMMGGMGIPLNSLPAIQKNQVGIFAPGYMGGLQNAAKTSPMLSKGLGTMMATTPKTLAGGLMGMAMGALPVGGVQPAIGKAAPVTNFAMGALPVNTVSQVATSKAAPVVNNAMGFFGNIVAAKNNVGTNTAAPNLAIGLFALGLPMQGLGGAAFGPAANTPTGGGLSGLAGANLGSIGKK